MIIDWTFVMGFSVGFQVLGPEEGKDQGLFLLQLGIIELLFTPIQE